MVSYDAIRSASKALGRFTQAELGAELGISPQQAKKHLEDLILDGIVRTPEDPEDRVRKGRLGRPQHVYEYVVPGDSPGISRIKRPTPEREAAAAFGSQRRSGTGIARKKQYAKPSRPEVRRLITKLEQAGLEVTGGGREHYQARDASGRLVTTLPVTPRGRGMKKAEGKINRAIRAA